MQAVRTISYIPVKIPHHAIMKRLGYQGKKTEISGQQMAEIDSFISKAAELISLKALCLRSRIELEPENGTVTLENGEVIESAKFCRFLSGSAEMLIMGITGGAEIADEIARLQTEKQMTQAVVLDAAAGEIVDDGFDWIAGLYSKELVREGRIIGSRRFSAGYGDFDITNQRLIYRMLGMEKLGVRITDSCMLLPEKSVTAVYGIRVGNYEQQ